MDFADFLIGAPTDYSQGQGYPSYGRSRYIGLFAQDSWRVKSEFDSELWIAMGCEQAVVGKERPTGNAGSGPAIYKFPGSPTGWVFPGDPGIPSTLAPTRYDNFAPRIGLAYSPSSDSGF